MLEHTTTMKRRSAGARRLRTALVLTACALRATTAIGQQVVFENMPHTTGAGQCLWPDPICGSDPVVYANGFRPTESGMLMFIELPIDWCSGACGQCQGGGFEGCEFEIRVALHQDSGNNAPGTLLDEWVWIGSCLHDGIVQINATSSLLFLVQDELYWLALDFVSSDATANISWDKPASGAPDADSTRVALDCQGWDTSCLDAGNCVRSAFRISALPDPDGPDADGDGLPDAWEAGIDVDGDGTGDLLADADPNVPDIYVEVDAMLNLHPAPSVKERAEAIFAGHGVNLHVQYDELDVVLANPVWFGDGAGGFTAFRNAHFGTLDERSDPFILYVKEKIYRYCVFADSTTDEPDRSGRGEIHGDDFMVTLGDAHWWNNGDTGGLRGDRTRENVQLGTFVHELGHTLGLGHGGADGINYKPNYYSVMNYSWQLLDGWMNANTWPLLALDDGTNRDGYSDYQMDSLNESVLLEDNGFGSTPADYAGVKTIFSHPPLPDGTEVGYTSLDATEVNWDQDDPDATSGPYSQNINKLGDDNNVDLNVLHGHDDWSALQYNFRDGDCYGDSFGFGCLIGGGDDGELDAETDQALGRILPPPCPGNLFGDDPVVFYDSFESGSLGYWDTSGSTNGVACGTLPNGSWCSSVDTVALSCDFSGRLAAEVTINGSPYNLLAEIRRTVSGANRLSATLRFDEIQGSGGTGHSRFQIAVLDPDNEANTYKYGFSSTGDTGGDTTIQVVPGQVLDFTAEFADDFLAKNGYELPGEAVLRIRSSVDYAENDPGDKTRSCDVAIDNIVMSLVTPSCPGDVDDDGTVGILDFLALLAAWGPNPGHPADLDDDGIVGILDFLALLAAWGSCPG